jgi:hypothetical protein
MKLEQELGRLRVADEHIARVQSLIERQLEAVHELKRNGLDAAPGARIVGLCCERTLCGRRAARIGGLLRYVYTASPVEGTSKQRVAPLACRGFVTSDGGPPPKIRRISPGRGLVIATQARQGELAQSRRGAGRVLRVEEL